MSEPDVALTDFALALECALFAVLLLRREAAPALAAWFAALFAALSAGSALGGVYHGFFSEGGGPLAEGLWLATLLVLGVVSAVGWTIAGELLWRGGVRTLHRAAAAVGLAGYAVAAVWMTRDFLLASAASGVAMLALLMGLLVAFARTRRRGALIGALGIAVAFGGAVQQQMGIGLHPVYFGHNAVYHVIEGVAFLLLFLAVDDAARAAEETSLLPGNR